MRYITLKYDNGRIGATMDSFDSMPTIGRTCLRHVDDTIHDPGFDRVGRAECSALLSNRRIRSILRDT